MKVPGFLSYSHEDGSELARGLAKYLKNLIPNFEPVYDEDVIEGEKIEKIKEKLSLCNILIVIITPGVLNSEAVAEEIKIAKEMNMKIITCKDKYLEKSWEELPWDLEGYKGFEFENSGELKRKTYASLVKILEQLSKELQKSLPKKTLAEKSQVPEKDAKVLAKKGLLGPQMFTMETQKQDYIITGDIEKGEILDVFLDRKALSLIAKIDVTDDSILRLILKRELINARKPNGEEDKFIVLIDGEEIDHKEIDLYVDTRTIEVNVPKKAREVEVIGTEIEGISYLGKVKQENIVKIRKGSSVPGCEETKQCVEPETLEIKIGDKVLWENNDSAAHSITSGSAADGPNGLFDSSLFMSGTTFEVTFTEKGEYPYFDMVHPWITGKIIVM